MIVEILEPQTRNTMQLLSSFTQLQRWISKILKFCLPHILSSPHSNIIVKEAPEKQRLCIIFYIYIHITCMHICMYTHPRMQLSCTYSHTPHTCACWSSRLMLCFFIYCFPHHVLREGRSLRQELSCPTSLLSSLILSLRIAGGLLYSPGPLHASEDLNSSSHFWQGPCSLSHLHSLL